MNEEEIRVVEMMERYGGSFVKALAQCFYRADYQNKAKLQKAFPEYWIEYTGFAKKYYEQNKQE